MPTFKFTLNENSWMTKLLYKPLFNVLVLLYAYIPGNDMGLAIIALTLIIRIILYPSYLNMLKSQRAMKAIQPQIDKLRELHKGDQTRQSQELMKVYKDNKISPFSSCFPMLIQLVILFALYRVFAFGLTPDSLNLLYDWFPSAPEHINNIFLSFTGVEWLMVDLSKSNLVLAIIAGISQFFQGWYMKQFQPAPKEGGGMMKLLTAQMMYVFPVITIFIAMSLPSALALYWIATTVFTVFQQYIAMRTPIQRLVSKSDEQVGD
jgi:YidC/Oxa1 family membrane protein insertase